MRKNLTHAIEDYLKIIYELTSDQERASTNQIADCMEVKPASVTGMVKRLSSIDPPLVEYHKHRGVVLTPEGELAALEIIRHHRLLELFLHETLGYSWDEVDAEADLLEHVISEELEERIAQTLGDPLHDPHGEPIPTRDLRLPPQSTTRLFDMRAGQRISVQWVNDADPELLRYLSSIGLLPQTRLLVLDYSPFDDNIHLQVEGQDEHLVLGPKITTQIFVDVL
jgi:DtxR family Mn-dependent transcriptional regulator